MSAVWISKAALAANLTEEQARHMMKALAEKTAAWQRNPPKEPTP